MPSSSLRSNGDRSYTLKWGLSAMRRQARTSPIGALNSKQIRRDLLAPIASFLIKSGMPADQLLAEFRRAINQASTSKLKVISMQIGEEASNIVNRWLRDPAFLNSAGRPADLSLTGPTSIEGLIKASQTKVSSTAALAMLIEFGLVRKVGSGKYRLVSRMVNFGHLQYLPFEPNYRFLVDATKVSTKRLPSPNGEQGLFWQCADNSRIDTRKCKEFLQFARQRSLSFMHEINDWLDEHEYKRMGPRPKNLRMKRVGIGLFGISR